MDSNTIICVVVAAVIAVGIAALGNSAGGGNDLKNAVREMDEVASRRGALIHVERRPVYAGSEINITVGRVPRAEPSIWPHVAMVAGELGESECEIDWAWMRNSNGDLCKFAGSDFRALGAMFRSGAAYSSMIEMIASSVRLPSGDRMASGGSMGLEAIAFASRLDAALRGIRR